MTDPIDLDVPAEVTEFTSLLRARLTGVYDDDNPAGKSPAEALWKEVHGTSQLEAGSMQELADKVGDLLAVKRNIAVVVAVALAIDLAKQTGRSAIDHIDDVEQSLIEGQQQ